VEWLEKKVANDGASEIASSVTANAWRTASRLKMYPTTEYREGRVVFPARDFPDAGCRIDFVRGRTSDDYSNRGLNRQVDRRGSAVAALTVATAPQRYIRNNLMSPSTSGSFGRCDDAFYGGGHVGMLSRRDAARRGGINFISHLSA